MAPKPTFDVVLTGDPAHARDTVHAALAGRGFRVEWDTPWTADAEQGSQVTTVLAGAFAKQHIRLRVAMSTTDQGHCMVRVARTSDAFWGGAIGIARARRAFDELHAELQATFAAAGVLLPPPPPAGPALPEPTVGAQPPPPPPLPPPSP